MRPDTMRRVSVVGTSGAGKTAFARRLAAALDVPHVELDELHWGPGWSAADAATFADSVRAATSGEAWIVDGNYQGKLGRLVWERADTVVWIDPPRWRVMWQVATRTFVRAGGRKVLWHGNTESWGGFAVWRAPEDSIIRWAWKTYSSNVARYEYAMRDPTNGGLTFHRLRSRREQMEFVDAVR